MNHIIFTSEIEAKRHIDGEYKTNLQKKPAERSFWAEVFRARWALYINSGDDPMTVAKSYNVQPEVIKWLLGEAPTLPEPKPKMVDKYQNIVDWCKANHLLQTDANKIAEVGEISYASALKFIKDRPDLFFKIKKGLYEVRDPKIIREQETS